MSWIFWAMILMAQNASFTWVSRARASSSIVYHGIGSVFSNGVWFVSQVVVVTKITDAFSAGDTPLLIFTGLFYVCFTAIGSVAAHKILMKIERGKMRVGFIEPGRES